VFEIGREIRPSTNFLPNEEHHLAAALYSAPGDEQDFFELKRVLESVFDGARLEGAEPKEGEHPARAAEIYWRGAMLGRFFELHPSLLEAEKIEGRAFLFNANLETALTRAFEPKRFTPVRRFPTSAFDLSVISELRQPVARIQDELVRLGGELIVSLEFVRQYAGPPLEPGTKSVSYRVELGAPERTLTSDEVANVRTALIEGMRTAGYELRV
jgi:phenylalanyl-tRNA synthetase beta chain